MDEEDPQSSWIDFLGSRADALIKAGLGSNPTTTPTPAAQQSATLFGLPIAQVGLYLVIGVVGIWLASKLFK